jgi:phosphatidate phosphatase LPIN
MREVVDHYFPPVNTLVKSGGEEYTDFTYWREPVLEIEDFSDSESDEKEAEEDNGSEDEDEDEDVNDDLGDSYISRDSIDEDNDLDESFLSGSIDEDENMTSSMLEAEEEETEDEDSDLTPGANGADQFHEGDDTQVVDLRALKPAASEERQADRAAESITGVEGLSLEREESDDIKV